VAHDVKLTSEKIAESAGATAKVSIVPAYDMTMNNEQLTEQMAPVLKRAAYGKVATTPLVGASEDFSFFAGKVPGLYFYLGVTPDGRDPAKAAPESQPEILRR
jgi:metal-dependent amidase/aminoacylase/carboxypeptidase family protein